MDEKCSQDMIGLYAKDAMDKIIRILNMKGHYLREDTLREIIEAVKDYQWKTVVRSLTVKDTAGREVRNG